MYLDRQSLRQMAGEVIVCGLHGVELTAESREVHQEIAPLGAILFSRNVEGPQQVHGLVTELKAWRPGTLVSVDQEGGRVARLREGVTVWPPMAAIGACGDPLLAHAVGHALGQQMRALGIDLNYAPVLDVHTNADNPIIGDRSFGRDPAVCARMGQALTRGLQSATVAACGKHFPGHGDTHVDSHLALPVVEADLERLRGIEWVPFQAAIEAGIASIMTAHIAYPAFGASAQRQRPATLRQDLLIDVLRQQLRFDGALISDDVDMKGLADHVGIEEIGPLGLQAGIDVFLACNDEARMLDLYAGIVRAAESGALPHAVLSERASRARALRTRWQRPYTPWPHAKEALARSVEGAQRLLGQIAQCGGG